MKASFLIPKTYCIKTIFSVLLKLNCPKKRHKNPHYDLNVWNRYYETINEVRKLDEIPASELNLLRTFILLEKTNDLRL
jgi:hypothetical protein